MNIEKSPSARTALITGITGQDGSYLTEHLLANGYTVHGLVRRASMFNRSRIDHLRAPLAQQGAGSGEKLKPETGRSSLRGDGEANLKPEDSEVNSGPRSQDSGLGSKTQVSGLKSQVSNARLVLHYGDLADLTSVRRLLKKVSPREVYHLAGQSHVGLSFEIPEVTCQENGMATLGLLEAMRDLDYPVRFYHAASAEMFGSPASAPQTEATPFNPVNPYGCAKVFATQLCRVYRNSYGLFACSGIAYNHESPRRGENFVTRKITLGAVRIKAGLQAVLDLGSLDARRDWGYAPEYVTAMWQMLQRDTPQDYILATGRTCTVREFALAAFDELGLKLKFEGKGVDEVGRRTDTGAVVVKVDSRYYRPADPSQLAGDASLAQKDLGWAPKTMGADVARLMVRADAAAIAEARRSSDRIN